MPEPTKPNSSPTPPSGQNRPAPQPPRTGVPRPALQGNLNRPQPQGAPAHASDAAPVGKGPDRPATGPGSFRPRGAPAAPAAPPPPPKPAKKKRRVRTKQCSKCMTPCILLTRARLDKAPVWYMICDICWARFCDTNPDYVYGGTWMNGRIMDPVQPQGGPGSSGLTPHHIHGPQIVRQRVEEMDDDEDDDDQDDDAPPARPAFKPTPKPATPAFVPRAQVPMAPPKPPTPPAIPAQLMADIDALEVEDGGEDGDEGDDAPETSGQPQGQPGQPGEGGKKKRRRRRKRKGGGGGAPQAGGAPANP